MQGLTSQKTRCAFLKYWKRFGDCFWDAMNMQNAKDHLIPSIDSCMRSGREAHPKSENISGHIVPYYEQCRQVHSAENSHPQNFDLSANLQWISCHKFARSPCHWQSPVKPFVMAIDLISLLALVAALIVVLLAFNVLKSSKFPPPTLS